MSETAAQHTHHNKFGTFAGVFLPSILAILGAVMYYIAPQVLGGVGLLKMLAIIVIAHSVTIATAFSISAIATNINVRGGGLYYLISRSLGSEFGGSLGVMLYLAQTIATSFYCMAFARGVASILARFGWVFPEYIVALFAIIVFSSIVFIGANFVVKIQYLILAAIGVSLVSIFLSKSTIGLESALISDVAVAIPFWVAFAMYFPAVTGIDAGVGMSGDLKNPGKSLVVGTFLAIFFTMIVYILLVVKLAMTMPLADLVSDPLIIEKVALFPSLVLLGVVMATSSSALSCLMTAPRCLRAMAHDRILPKWLHFLGSGLGKDHSEPRVALLLSVAIGIAIILAGPLEFVSQVVSMFFLSVYGWINGAAFFEKVSQNPSYRPTFEAPLVASFYGMVVCYAIMFLFSPRIMLMAVAFQFLVFYLLYRSKKSMKFESVWDGVFFQLLRVLMKRISVQEESKKNWRPTMVAFCANHLNKIPLANVLHWIGSNRSISKMYFLVKGELKQKDELRDEFDESLKTYVQENNLEIFPRTIATTSHEDTVNNIIQAETLGTLPLNTVLIDFDKQLKLEKLISDMDVLKKNIMILRNQSGFTGFKKVDVWWKDEEGGNLLILLAYLITHSKQWLENDAIIRIFKVVKKMDEASHFRQKLDTIIAESRIENAEVNVIEGTEKDLHEVIRRNSENSDLVIMGIPRLGKKRAGTILDNIEKFTNKLKVTLVVHANDVIDFKVN